MLHTDIVTHCYPEMEISLPASKTVSTSAGLSVVQQHKQVLVRMFPDWVANKSCCVPARL